MKNLLAGIPLSGRDELFEELLRGGEFRVERIVSQGQATPASEWYDQATDEWVLLVAGAARLRFAQPDEIHEMRPGDYLNIPARQRHRVDWTDPDNPTVWLAMHYAARAKDEGVTERSG